MEELLKTAEKGPCFSVAMAGPMGETLVDRMHREIEIMTRRSLENRWDPLKPPGPPNVMFVALDSLHEY